MRDKVSWGAVGGAHGMRVEGGTSRVRRAAARAERGNRHGQTGRAEGRATRASLRTMKRTYPEELRRRRHTKPETELKMYTSRRSGITGERRYRDCGRQCVAVSTEEEQHMATKTYPRYPPLLRSWKRGERRARCVKASRPYHPSDPQPRRAGRESLRVPPWLCWPARAARGKIGRAHV